jgi:hypothetical protein
MTAGSRVVLAVLLLGERLTPTLVVGGGGALAGVYVGAFSQARARRSTATSDPGCLPVEDCPPGPTAPPRRATTAGRP